MSTPEPDLTDKITPKAETQTASTVADKVADKPIAESDETPADEKPVEEKPVDKPTAKRTATGTLSKSASPAPENEETASTSTSPQQESPPTTRVGGIIEAIRSKLPELPKGSSDTCPRCGADGCMGDCKLCGWNGGFGSSSGM